MTEKPYTATASLSGSVESEAATPQTHKCIVCGDPVDDYEPEMCCDGWMCGCMGLPVEPPLCSLECTEQIYGKGTVTVHD